MYTNTTKVSLLTNIRRARLLPRAGEVVVTIGQDVNPVHVLARATDPASYQILQASELLDIPAERLSEYLLVEEGSALKRGTPLMRKPGLFGRSKVYRSPVEGILHQVRDGCLVMERVGGLIELRAMIPGRVVSIIPGKGAVVETTGSLIQGQWDSGKDGFGKLRMAVGLPGEELVADRIGRDAHGAVLVAGTITQITILELLEEVGVRGLIVGSLPSRLSKDTGAFPFPVIATDGIGEDAMSQPIFELLKQSESRQVSVLASQVGPRGLRSEIVIPLPSVQSMEQLTNIPEVMSLGSQVRVWRMGTGAMVGKVTQIHTQPRKTQVGALLPGADVELADGRVVFVPLRNLDLLN